jgi:hypothetical protein
MGRKRIATSGFVTIKLAAGIYGPTLGTLGGAVLTTYHADADRIVIEGTMQASQTPPLTGHFQRTGPSAAQRANDSAFNIQMLRARYATEIRMPSTPASGIQHLGPGMITYKNLLITGPNFTFEGMRGVSAESSSIYCVQCSIWGSADAGFVANANGSISAMLCHACSCGTRGFVSGGGSAISIQGGGSYGNGTNGIEAAHGGAIGTNATDQVTLSLGFQSSCNGSVGASGQSGYILATLATIIANQYADMYAYNMGTVAQFKANVGTMSPIANTEGNLNSISVNYG